jgi:hypothetical protein
MYTPPLLEYSQRDGKENRATLAIRVHSKLEDRLERKEVNCF